jgi:hypothetical protein
MKVAALLLSFLLSFQEHQRHCSLLSVCVCQRAEGVAVLYVKVCHFILRVMACLAVAAYSQAQGIVSAVFCA